MEICHGEMENRCSRCHGVHFSALANGPPHAAMLTRTNNEASGEGLGHCNCWLAPVPQRECTLMRGDKWLRSSSADFLWIEFTRRAVIAEVAGWFDSWLISCHECSKPRCSVVATMSESMKIETPVFMWCLMQC